MQLCFVLGAARATFVLKYVTSNTGKTDMRVNERGSIEATVLVVSMDYSIDRCLWKGKET